MDNRLKKIFKILGPDIHFKIYAVKNINKFHRQNIDPYFLYLSRLPVNKIIPNSVLVYNNKITIYADYDKKIGMNPENIKPLKDLPKNIPEITEEIKNKINHLRQIKSNWEIKQLQYSIHITLKALDKMKNMIHTNKKITENNLEGIFYDELVNNNCSYAYPPIIASGKNAAFIHYELNNSPISKKDLVLMDCGAKNIYGYCADITQTILPKHPNKYQKIVYDIVEKAFKDCFIFLRKNITLKDLNDICIKSFLESLPKLKIKNKNNWNKFLDDPDNLFILYPHFIGHSVGLDVHDPGLTILKNNVVFTIEPGLYFPDNIEIIPDEYKKVGGVRIEHMILMKEKPIIMG